MRMKLSTGISSSYKKSVIEAAILCSILLILSFLALDGGQMASASLLATAAFWTGVLLIVLRRPQSPTQVDLGFISFGSLLIYLLAQVLAPWIWHLRGISF